MNEDLHWDSQCRRAGGRPEGTRCLAWTTSKSAGWLRAAGLADVAEALAEKRHALESDLGGPTALGVVRRDLVQAYLEADVLRATLGLRLQADGVLTTRGKPRALLAAYLQVTDRWLRIALAVGLDRVPKDALTLGDYLQTRYAESRNSLQDASVPAPMSADQRPTIDDAPAGRPCGDSPPHDDDGEHDDEGTP